MKCHEFQTAIAAEPNSTDAGLLAHIEECEACAKYRQQMQDMDRLIHRALMIPVDLPETAQPVAKNTSIARWQIAATLLASVLIGTSVWIASTRESFAEQIVTHADHESFAIVRTEEQVDSQTLTDVLSRSNLSLRPNAAHVSYASSCPFRGHEVPHLVVQTDKGPVTVLVLVHEKSSRAIEQINEDGYEGVIVPAPRGVLAVIGKDVPVQEATQKLLWAIEYW
jgi:hypothetical protein